MLEDYFNADVVSQMTFEEFYKANKGNQNLVRLRIDIKEAFKQLGGKMYKAKKAKKSND